ncbi:histidine phosphatase family protein [Neolewinella aurantiaca]|uniref:Histidine phosphatase family protein n=1 Tax=Neolewinella aurantiaca TaxID=2602767 RepID=A0A5C7FMJ1_9BACT|nr:histidine phosphatase family protein [Neolewinella aurantiaca]TXF91290.1 histidine phosphatase family protein [Neolewinella aurantiaca]
MRTLYFIRHAKSSWDDPTLDDHSRPLNKRGRRDGPVMARRLLGIDVAPDGLLSSTAKRTRQTAAYFKDILSVENTIYLRELYHASPQTIEAQIKKLPDEWETVLIFGHNPGYTDLANRLKNDVYLENVPTCGIVGARSDVDEWKDFTLEGAKRIAYLYPKQTE